MEGPKYYLVTSENVRSLSDLSDDNTIGFVEARSQTEYEKVKRHADANDEFLLDVSRMSMSALDYIEDKNDEDDDENESSVDKAVNKLIG